MSKYSAATDLHDGETIWFPKKHCIEMPPWHLISPWFHAKYFSFHGDFLKVLRAESLVEYFRIRRVRRIHH